VNIDESYLTFYAGPKSDHFDGESFYNPWGRMPRKGLWDILKWRVQGERSEWPERVENPKRPPLVERSDALRVTYIGHASFFVQVKNINLLIDPVFSERCSPFTSVGPKRVRDPFVPMDKLPKIDFIFVSHNHYDHLDLASLSWLARNHKPMIYTPLGNTRIIKPCSDGCTMLAMDWHDTAPIGKDLSLSVTPAQHWSRRGFNDISRDLWGGMFLKTTDGQSLYYCGDSGFHKGLFEEIRKKYGAPDIALLPAGAYEPSWFMKYSHMNPEEAVATFKLLQARQAMAFHHETFQLSDEPFEGPRTALEALKIKENIGGQDFIVPYPGDVLSLAD
jgi:L-ascorbate metabolism protein UlaG (beta-lactamase superfamily)